MQKDCAVLYACACLPSYGGICLVLNVLACPAMHLCVLLGKKARLHLMFSLAKAKILPSLLDVCLKESPEIIPTFKKNMLLSEIFIFQTKQMLYNLLMLMQIYKHTFFQNQSIDNHCRHLYSEGTYLQCHLAACHLLVGQ